MKKTMLILSLFLLAVNYMPPEARAQENVYPIAILTFEERGAGVTGMGATVRDLMFAGLIENMNLFLVERAELDKILEEAKLNLSGNVAMDKATQVGQLTGAKILITGSIFKVGKKNYIVAKLIGTETSRVLGKSINGVENVDVLAERLAKQVDKIIVKSAGELMPPKVEKKSNIARLKSKIEGKALPKVYISIREEHVGRRVVDPAAETEMAYIYKAIGGEVIDRDAGDTDAADLKIIGEGFSEFSTTIKNLVSVKARLEVKVLDKKGNIIAIDRQTTVKVDLNEMLAGKTALQEAALLIADRIIPKMVQ